MTSLRSARLLILPNSTYNVLVKIGGIETPLILDTGSSDLWVISDACTKCASTVPLYPQASLQSTGLDVALYYGDSSTGTHAIGPIGKDVVGLGDLTLQNQYFAAVNDTNTSVGEAGSAGIFGLGFAVNRYVAHWQSLDRTQKLIISQHYLEKGFRSQSFDSFTKANSPQTCRAVFARHRFSFLPQEHLLPAGTASRYILH